MKFRIVVQGMRTTFNGMYKTDETYIVSGEIKEDAENVAIAAFLQEYGSYRDWVDVIECEEIEE